MNETEIVTGNNPALSALRRLMQEHHIDAWLVPTADYHESEYVGAYFQTRRFLTGFTGSAGTAVVLMEEAGLWTDGRYFLQAGAELKGSGFTLYKMGEEGVPTIEEFLESHLPENGVVGFDGRCVSTKKALGYKAIAEKKNGSVCADLDLCGEIWTDRPGLPERPIYRLLPEQCGEDAKDKITRLRAAMEKKKADCHVLTTLPDIAWLLNLRAGDIAHVPVFLSFLILTRKGLSLFVRDEILSDEIKEYLKGIDVLVCPYDAFYDALEAIPQGEKVLMDQTQANYRTFQALGGDAERIIDEPNPTELMKAQKNQTEISSTRQAHLKDGVALTKFIYRLKQMAKAAEQTSLNELSSDSAEQTGQNELPSVFAEQASQADRKADLSPLVDPADGTPLTEYTAAQMLDGLRAEQEGFLETSFETISGYEQNGAIVHYQAQKETAATLYPKGFLLVDSGGHYKEGTTDVTRTIALGPVTESQKHHFTLVLKGCLKLADARFLKGTGGRNLDILAREALWKEGLDYNHGTGHGVGHLLNVHEGPNSFRYKTIPGSKDDDTMRPGMITSDEPGLYLTDQYGIRIENELLCVEDEKNAYGQFLRFEVLTLAPIDLNAVDPALLGTYETQILNAYHKRVYDSLSPYLDEPERAWLVKATRAI